MRFFKVRFGLDSGKQQELLRKLQSSGLRVIQSADGLVVASGSEPDTGGAAIEEIRAGSPGLTKDIRAFLRGSC